MVGSLSMFALAMVVRITAGSECSSGTDSGDVKGSAMLQVRLETPSSSKKVECSQTRARDQPLTEEGFAEVSASCCFEDVKTYTRRLIDSLGYKVCDEGGLSGISPFYSCPPSPVTFAELKEELSGAVQTKDSKCHWLADRYAECVPVSVECHVSVQAGPPAPEPVATGFIAFHATNPAEMVRSSRIINLVTEEIALATGVNSDFVNVVMGTGTVDGEKSISFFRVPTSQAFFAASNAVGTGSRTCKVFALYSIQENAPPAGALTTPTPTVNEASVVDKLQHIDAASMSSRITQDLSSVDAAVGDVEVIETTTCAKTSGTCNHNVIVKG